MNWLLDWLNWGPDTSNFMSTIIGVIVGVLISWWIYVLQERDAKLQEKGLDNLVDLTQKVDSYIEEQRKLSQAIKLSSLRIIAMHINAVEERIARYLVIIEKNRSSLDSKELESFQATIEKFGYVFQIHSQAIAQQAEFLRPYISPELYGILVETANKISFTLISNSEESHHTNNSSHLVDVWIDRFHTLIKSLDNTRSEISQMLENKSEGADDSQIIRIDKESGGKIQS
jgi:hypothetical protein